MLNMKKSLPLFFLFFVLSRSYAQAPMNGPDTTMQLSIKEAVDYALKNQKDVVNAELDAEIAKDKVKETIGIGLPQLNASFDVKDFEKIPTTTLTDFITPSIYNVLFNENVIPRKDLGAPAQFPVQFGTKWNATAGLILEFGLKRAVTILYVLNPGSVLQISLVLQAI